MGNTNNKEKRDFSINSVSSDTAPSNETGKTEVVITELQQEIKRLKNSVNNLSYVNDNLETKNTELEIKVSKKVSKIGNITLGFIIGFLFSMLLIFTLWFLSLLTEDVANFYSQIFCSNLAR